MTRGVPPAGELLEIALVLAREAGTLLQAGRPAGPLRVSSKSTPTDVVTEMDHAAEALITAALARLRPQDGILGEEGTDRTGTSGVRWVVDPLDGTVNYLYDLGGWAVSIAAELDGEGLVGVVQVPSTGETFAAVRGEGATCNGRPLRCGPGPDLDRALVATGFGYDPRRRAHQAEILRHVLPAVRDIRRNGACAVDLCALAAGRVDAYFERGVKHWDYAAGALIATEAGARVAGLGGAEPSSACLVAAAPELFVQLEALLLAAGAGDESGLTDPVATPVLP
ncbi:inositol monophosphatase family protein [Sporichthya sp.]|uniref:inositol monophosphatase family protein n=1 Tax=Sporichthya sp. TaxID=65475 RepID=UPI0017EAE52B|nr:inositol monophosphatase family protein [Sporichthya sp.]MBA3745641.1 inositol monophosphatase [Sporichthya sp.]